MTVRTATRREAGARYEDFARVHLERAGLALLARNYTCRYGEIDLVMRDAATLVFVEVRYRRGGGTSRYGDGADSIGSMKRTRLQRAAAMFLAQHPAFATSACRFDVVSIAGDAPAAELHWLRNAFEAS
ncbi:MAG: YraN family protein [Dokdonella sp.]|uniref:YraN family protein n=1 Tax=Dokdonella sp. TaxID=2291710 RepID=UPI003F81F0E2